MKANPSTRNLGSMPERTRLRRTCQAIAMLDAILEPEWEYRYYSFNSKWDEKEEMASMRDGSGDSYFVLFKSQGIILKGFANESPMGIYAIETGHPWPGVLEDVPAEFKDFLAEPAFSLNETSFCMWNLPGSKDWRIGNINFPEGPDPDGSGQLLNILDGNPYTYLTWAEEYFGRTLKSESIERVYRHEPLTAELVNNLNPDISINDLKEDIIEIGYPIA